MIFYVNYRIWHLTLPNKSFPAFFWSFKLGSRRTLHQGLVEIREKLPSFADRHVIGSWIEIHQLYDT